MSITIDLPPELEKQLRSSPGPTLEEQTREALAIKFYSESKLSIGQLAQLLGIGVIEAEAWLSERRVPIPMTPSDLLQEVNSVANRQ
jgi:predicted HTH domain antitoxin